MSELIEKALTDFRSLCVELIPVKYAKEEILDYVLGLSTSDCIVQLVKHELIIDELQVKVASYNTFKAFERGTNRAKKVSVEFLLNLTCKTQIRDAIKVSAPKLGDCAFIIISCKGRRLLNELRTRVRQDLRDYIAKEFKRDEVKVIEFVKKFYGLRYVKCSLNDDRLCTLFSVLSKIALHPYRK